MPDYNYACEKCKFKDLVDSKLNEDFYLYVPPKSSDILSEDLVWTISHMMDEKPDIKCPVCLNSAYKTFAGVNVSGYVRGAGYLDKRGVKRDQNVFKLQHEDPYADMRQPGEVDELVAKFKNMGRYKTVNKHLITIKDGQFRFNPSRDSVEQIAIKKFTKKALKKPKK